MKPNQYLLAIASIATLLALSAYAPVALADKDDDYPRAHAGPILSMQQLIRIVLQVAPDTEVEEINLEPRGERGLIYVVKLNDDREVYVNARSGEVLEIEED
ncbi:MAG: PepSY domain-containing protein [Oculatellaceae cyanobacterium bins.114]|nr:PepSY domain-containing protein [Oculatellaceae cyanobacterium bins.114]